MADKICPQCGEPTATLPEGYCADCWGDNQRSLDEHNAAYDAWQAMTDAERTQQISDAMLAQRESSND